MFRSLPQWLKSDWNLDQSCGYLWDNHRCAPPSTDFSSEPRHTRGVAPSTSCLFFTLYSRFKVSIILALPYIISSNPSFPNSTSTRSIPRPSFLCPLNLVGASAAFRTAASSASRVVAFHLVDSFLGQPRRQPESTFYVDRSRHLYSKPSATCVRDERYSPFLKHLPVKPDRIPCPSPHLYLLPFHHLTSA